MSAIISAGIIPAAVEMMDALAIQAAEAAVKPNFPKADTILIVELDGPAAEVRELFTVVEDICRTGRCHDDRSGAGRTAARAHLEGAQGGIRRDGTCVAELLRAGRRRAAHASCREVLDRIRDLGERNGLRIGNVFHAGDGNLHPLICYDERIPGQAALAEEVAGEILTYCVEAGGSITGEHGVGADKKEYMPKMFSDDDLDVMQRVRDAFDPQAPLQSRQGAADAAAVRRGSRSLPAASGREGRSRRTDLMTAIARTGFSRPSWRSLAPLAPADARRCHRRRHARARHRADDTRAAGGGHWLGVARAAAHRHPWRRHQAVGWGRTPPRVDVVLSTARLNRRCVHRHGDLTATVQAGRHAAAF